jgi:hypothetical protein
MSEVCDRGKHTVRWGSRKEGNRSQAMRETRPRPSRPLPNADGLGCPYSTPMAVAGSDAAIRFLCARRPCRGITVKRNGGDP